MSIPKIVYQSKGLYANSPSERFQPGGHITKNIKYKI